MVNILKVGSNILKTNNSIFKVGEDIPPATLFQISTLSGLSNLDPVSIWEDSSGNNNDLLQIIPTSQPLYVTNAHGSISALRFDGVNDSMVLLNVTQVKTFMVVIRFLSPVGQSRSPILGGITSADDYFDGGYDGAKLFRGDGVTFSSGSGSDKNRGWINTGQISDLVNTNRPTSFCVISGDVSRSQNPNFSRVFCREQGLSHNDVELIHLETYTERLSDTQRVSRQQQLITLYNL